MQKKKELICIHHVPGYMMIDITNAFAEQYDKVYLLAGEIRKRRKSLSGNVEWVKLIKYNPGSNLSRLFTWLWAFVKMFFFVLFKSRNADLFITTNPPLGIFLPLIFKNRYTILVYDIYPDVLHEYQLFKSNHFIIKWWQRVNKKVFEGAHRVITIGEGMKSKISNYINEGKIEIISCWTDSEFLKPIPKHENEFIKQYQLQDKFLVMYSGNLGVTHDVEVLVELAEMTTNPKLFFLIIGEGDKRKMLASLIEEKKLKNIMLLPWQPIEMLPFSLSAADLAVVTLGKGASLMSVPSKLYDTMAVGSPLLIIAEENSEMALIVDKFNIGKTFSSDQKLLMLEYIEHLLTDVSYSRQLRENAIEAAQSYTSRNALLFQDV